MNHDLTNTVEDIIEREDGSTVFVSVVSRRGDTGRWVHEATGATADGVVVSLTETEIDALIERQPLS